MKISVTQHHIDDGEPCEADICPIALAIKEQVPNVDSVMVLEQTCTIEYEDGGYSLYDLPDEAVDFVFEFDSNGDVEPFEFELTTKEK